MKVTELHLAGHGAWPNLVVDRLSPTLNVFCGPPRSGKSTVAHLATHLLYGKTDSPWRRQFGQTTPLAEGSLAVAGVHGKYLLRRHRDDTPHGRLSVAAVDGAAADSRTVRDLLFGVSPQLLGQVYAVDFSEPPQASALLDGEFAREFTLAAHPYGGVPVASPGAGSAAAHSAVGESRDLGRLVRSRDCIVREIEEHMSGRRLQSAAVERELADVDAVLLERRRRGDEIHARLRGLEADLAALDSQLRYFSLESAVGHDDAPEDLDQRNAELERLDGEIARCRQSLAELAARDAAVRREIAEVHPDGTGESGSTIADQRAAISLLELLLDDLDAEVSQLARAHEPGPGANGDAHLRLVPVSQMLRQQLYTLCGHVAEHERAARHAELSSELRQLARSQCDVSEHLEHLLGRRQTLVHRAKLARQPQLQLPQPPMYGRCQCRGHDSFVRSGGAMTMAGPGRARQEAQARRRRGELERDLAEARAAWDALQQEIASLELRRDRLHEGRVPADRRAALEQLQSELARLEHEIKGSLHRAPSPTVAPTAAVSHRRIWKASDALAQLTGGQLSQIRIDRGGRGVKVIDRAGRVLDLAQLSPPQQDQLYLALTLALVSSFGSRAIDLPLVLDEPFLRQDAAGAAAMAGALDEFAREGRQMLVFTEDREAVRRLQSLGAEVRDLDAIRHGDQRGAPARVAAGAATVVPAPLDPAAVSTLRVVRETVGQQSPPLRVTGHWSAEDEHDAYYLTADAPVGEFPVLGNDTTAAFAPLGITTVDDLLAADATEIAQRLGRSAISADAVRLWQTHMSLMCFVPGVSLADAQVLAANEVTSPEALFTIDVRLLADSIERFFSTERGRRFASSRHRFTRDRLASLQKLARQNRDFWQLASGRFRWPERPAPMKAAKTSRLRETAPTARRAKAAAPRVSHADQKPLRFYLARTSPAAEAPSIGPTTAERLTGVGIRTVADLLNVNPEATAEELGDPRLTAAIFTRWQRQARLACCIPELRAKGAQILVACGLTEPEQIAGASAAELTEKVQAFCRTDAGHRILRNGRPPSPARIAAWIRHAAQPRPLEAA